MLCITLLCNVLLVILLYTPNGCLCNRLPVTYHEQRLSLMIPAGLLAVQLHKRMIGDQEISDSMKYASTR